MGTTMKPVRWLVRRFRPDLGHYEIGGPLSAGERSRWVESGDRDSKLESCPGDTGEWVKEQFETGPSEITKTDLLRTRGPSDRERGIPLRRTILNRVPAVPFLWGLLIFSVALAIWWLRVSQH